MRRTISSRPISTRRRAWEDGLSLLIGAGIGAGVMYVLDPYSGAKRRRRIAATTRQALAATGEAIAPAIETVTSRASELGHSMAESVGHLGSRLASSGQEYLSHAGESISQRATDVGERISHRGRSWFNGRRGHWFGRSRQEYTGLSAAPVAAGGLGLLALGAGLAWLLDPDLGEARRHWIRDKSFSLLRDVGDLFRKTGKHLSNRAYGAYAEARGAFTEGEVSDRQLEQRVRSQLGRVVSDMDDLTVIAEGGCVTLVGSVASDQVQPALATAREVRGVREVIDQLRPAAAPPPAV